VSGESLGQPNSDLLPDPSFRLGPVFREQVKQVTVVGGMSDPRRLDGPLAKPVCSFLAAADTPETGRDRSAELPGEEVSRERQGLTRCDDAKNYTTCGTCMTTHDLNRPGITGGRIALSGWQHQPGTSPMGGVQTIFSGKDSRSEGFEASG
jgi:hypothetical protein